MRWNYARQAELGLLGFFVLALIWAPIPLASNRDWGVAILAAWVWLLLAATLAVQAWITCRQYRNSLLEQRADSRRGRHDIVDLVDANPPGSTRGAWLMAALLASFGLWCALPLLGYGYTADAFSTRQYVLRSATYVGAFMVVLRLVNTPRRRLFLMYGVLTSGVLQALVAVVLFSAGSQYEIFGHPAGNLRASGTFANPDHLAQFMVLSLAAGLGIMLSQLGSAQAKPRNARERALALMRFVMSPKMLVRLLLVLLVLTLVLTRSRAGNGAFFLALFLLAGWVMVTSPRLRMPAGLLVVSLLVVDLIVIGQWVGLEKVVQRLQATEIAQQAETAASGPATPARVVYREETLEERMRAAKDALVLVQQRPWTGWGGGTFYTVFPQVKKDSLALRYDHVHNDYVEIAADTGLTGLALLGLAVLLTAWRLLRLMSDHTPALDRGLAAGIGMGLFCALLHAGVDFNLQVTTNALMLTVLLAVAWSVPVPARPEMKSK